MIKRLCEAVALVTARKPDTDKKFTDLHQLSQKEGLFTGMRRVFIPKDDGGESYPPENKELQLRYSDVLENAAKTLSDLFDLVLVVDKGNQNANADIVVDGKVIVSGVPVTTLIYLENRLTDLETFFKKLPVLDPAKEWSRDEANSCFTNTIVKNKQKVIKKPIVLYQATEQHPAQTQLVEETIVTGEWKETETSGAIPANVKSGILARVRLLKEAVVLAREQANQSSVDEKNKIGRSIFDYIYKG